MSLLRRDLVSRAWKHLVAERSKMAGLALLAVVTAQAESAALVSIALIAESVASGSSTVAIVAGPLDLDLETSTAATLALTSVVVAGLIGYVYGRVSGIISARLEREGRDQIVTAFASASWEHQATQKSSLVQGRLMRLMDARAVSFSSLVRWARALATIVVFIIVAAVMSLVGALVIVMFGALLSLAVFPIRRRIMRLAGDAAEREVSVATDFAEAVEHGADVQVFGAWPAFTERFTSRSSGLEFVRARLNTTKALMPIVYQYGALSLILAVMLIASGSATNGDFGPFAASALLLLRSVQYGQQLQQSLQQLAEAVPRVDLLDRESNMPHPLVTPGEKELGSLQSLELTDVSYHYPDMDVPAITSINVRLEPGSIVGVAGPSGSGKSTLAQVMLRLRWPTSGRFLVNGEDASVFTADSWRQKVSHVPQHPLLLHGTLFENVSFLDETISRTRVSEALHDVGLDDLVDSLPGGLDAQVGPTVRSLSGGQVQRLGIARALVRNPQLIVLDEPTSALDVDSERIVAAALDALRGRNDVVVIVIAHRPSTLSLCDAMVVLENGSVAAKGRTDDVTLGSGFLSRIWESTVSESGRA